MLRVTVVHWNAEEGEQRARELREAGFAAVVFIPDRGHLKPIRDNPPDVIVIDLTRLPSHGRDVGLALQQYKDTRTVPLVFAGGQPEKVDRVKTSFPDAVFASIAELPAVLRRPRAPAAAKTVAPGRLAGYSGTPLPRKLGIQKGEMTSLINAPSDFAESLDIEDHDCIHRGSGKPSHRVLLFAERFVELEHLFSRAEASVSPGGGLWIIWPKKASGHPSDLTEPAIRQFALAANWVDYKVCAIDHKWSGLLFARKRVAEGDPVDSTRAGRRRKGRAQGS